MSVRLASACARGALWAGSAGPSDATSAPAAKRRYAAPQSAVAERPRASAEDWGWVDARRAEEKGQFPGPWKAPWASPHGTVAIEGEFEGQWHPAGAISKVHPVKGAGCAPPPPV